jgi:hypothetical protein
MRLDISSAATAAAIATAETIDSDAISRSLALLVRYNQITSRKILLARLLQPMHADRAIHALRGDFDDSQWSLARCRTGLTSQNAGCYVLRDLENDIGQMRA